MAVLDRPDLEASSLADLHSIAEQIGLDGFRRLRKAELIDLILTKGGPGEKASKDGVGRQASKGEAGEQASKGEAGEQASKEETEDAEDRSTSSRRRRMPRRRRSQEKEAAAEGDGAADDDAEEEASASGSGAARRPASGSTADKLEQVEGVVEVLGNGSAFVRLAAPHSSDGDIYISAAQVRRCELVSGDRVGGPVRRPRRSERYPSLARIDTINGEPADSASRAVKFESLPARFPSERFELGSEDPTLKAIEWLIPIGQGSRAVIVGATRSGKTETLRRLLGALAGKDGLEITLLLLGARPEELHDWEQGPCQPTAALTLSASADAQGQALERAVETAKRLAARGGNALLAIDSLDGVHPHVARRALAAARNIHESGSLTVIATAGKPFGGETTVIALDALLTSTGRLPALDLLQSGTLRPELLIGEDSAAEIVKARAALAE